MAGPGCLELLWMSAPSQPGFASVLSNPCATVWTWCSPADAANMSLNSCWYDEPNVKATSQPKHRFEERISAFQALHTANNPITLSLTPSELAGCMENIKKKNWLIRPINALACTGRRPNSDCRTSLSRYDQLLQDGCYFIK